MKVEQASTTAVADVWSAVESRVAAAKNLEIGAQALSAALYDHFTESLVLARVFVTVPFSELPESNQRFVRGLVETAGAADLKPSTPVLSLVGSSGKNADWNDRRKSKGHIGIPMVSSAFVAAIPMISRLLKELGVPIDWVDSHDSEMIIDTIGNQTGLFFVENAARAFDTRGRHIIAAQDFVSECGVQSVFGMGGAYSTGQIAVIVAFCRDQISREVAERFVPLAAFLVSKTAAQVEQGKIFND